jgi:molybdate transport system substrate-binding protein
MPLLKIFSLFPVLVWSLINPALFASEFISEARVAVAANFTDVSREIAKQFEQQTGYKTKISYGSTGKLYAQIVHGAPFDVFLAADSRFPARAVREGYAVEGSQFVYARGKLVLWGLKNRLFDDGEAWLKQANFKHIAMGNPKTAPYGLAAKQVLDHLGIQQAVQGKQVRGESVAQTFQFVAAGNVAAGFVAWSQVKAWQHAHESAGTLWKIPDNHYAPLEQAAVLLKKGEANPAAKAFLDFLQSDRARNIINDSGYGVE